MCACVPPAWRLIVMKLLSSRRQFLNRRRNRSSPGNHVCQEAGRLLSDACSFDASDTNSPYNAACAFALAGDPGSCFRAFSEYCRRLTLNAAPPVGVSSGKREAARQSLREAGSDADLEGVRGAPWFVDLLRGTDAALVGSG